MPPRQPYAGELVFTAFSGSHQDAIKKSLAKQKPGQPWDVLYIPIDPADIGRSYRAIIRINSQSGKGGVAYVLEQEYGYHLPKLMHREIGRIVNDIADAKGTELTSEDIRDAFQREYLGRTAPLSLGHFKTTERDSTVTCEAHVVLDGEALTLSGSGNGPIDAFVRSLGPTALPEIRRGQLLRALARRRRRGQGGELHPDQAGAGGRLLRRGHRHQHRARVHQGDRERAQPGGPAAP